MQKKVSSVILSTLVAASAFLGLSQKANALGFVTVMESTFDEGQPNYEAEVLWSIGLTGAGVINLLVGNFVGGAILFLDNPSDAVSQMSDKIETYGANSEEAKNLATVFVNAQIKESKS